MKLEVYVGNYPSQFSDADLLNLFQDFEGIQLLRTKTKNCKRFAFFQCVDEDQVIDVVIHMHGIDVCSRNLVVRATDEDMQTIIEETMQKDKLPNLHPKNRNRQINNNYCSHFISEKSYRPDNIDDLPYGIRFRNPLLDKGMERDYDKKRYGSQPHPYHSQSPTQSESGKESILSLQNLSIHDTELSKSNVGCQNLSNASPKRDGKVKCRSPNAEENLPMNAKFEDRPTERINSYQRNSSVVAPNHSVGISTSSKACSSSGISSCNERAATRYEVINYSDARDKKADTEPSDDTMYYVSVANFPLHTTIAHLYEIFQDTEPDGIVMICNSPNREKRVTEAILCFKSEDRAVDTIMDHDNTLYNGRYLIVSDACDKPMLPF